MGEVSLKRNKSCLFYYQDLKTIVLFIDSYKTCFKTIESTESFRITFSFVLTSTACLQDWFYLIPLVLDKSWSLSLPGQSRQREEEPFYIDRPTTLDQISLQSSSPPSSSQEPFLLQKLGLESRDEGQVSSWHEDG